MTGPIARRNGKYAVTVGGKHVAPTITGVIGLLNKPGLPWGAAAETALFALHHQDDWLHLDLDAAYDRLRKHHKGVWNDKANRGTLVHSLAVEWAQGREVDCPPDCGVYLDALEQFYVDWQPEWVQCERSVIYPDPPTGGTFDAIVDLADGNRWLIDIKTGRDIWPEVRLQLAAYRHAPHMGVYDDTGNLVAMEPVPEVDRCGVLHLRDDGTYALVPVEAGEHERDVFLLLRGAWDFVHGWENDWPPTPATTPRERVLS